MDFQSAMETFAEAWVAANTKTADPVLNGPQNQALALTTNRDVRTPSESPASVPCSPAMQPATALNTTPPTTPYPAHVTEDAVKSGGKSLPVHCIVETVWSLQQWKAMKHTRKAVVETDSYVIIPVNTTFEDLVQVALQRLGYGKDNAASAKGSVVIKNWKPLSFDKIAESPLVTVGEILGELTTVATLRIQILRPRQSVLSDMKDKLLRLLVVQSHALLLSSGCPLDEMTISQLVRSQGPPLSISEPTEECRRKFDQWWSLQLSQQLSPRPRLLWHSPPHPDPERKMDRLSEDRVHPALQTVQNQYPTPTTKTRMRTSFDPELELPKLQRWFCENPHPGRQLIQQYVKDLNSLESRRGRKPLDVNNVVYWFKNARAAQKRAEVRSLNPGVHCNLSLNGYNSNSHSPSDNNLMLKSPDSPPPDDDEEEDNLDNNGGRHSPIGPLSLITNRNSDQRSPSREPVASPSNQTEGIKQEPPDQSGHLCQHSPGSQQNNNNNNKEINNEISEDEEDEMDDGASDEESNKTSEIQNSEEDNRIQPYRNPNSPDFQMLPKPPGGPGFPMVPNSMFSHSIMYMSHYIPSLNVSHNTTHTSPQGLNLSALADERRKRNRTFIDPVSEVPRLEQWFALNTHPSHNHILKYTDDLNRMPYRQKFPRLEPKNVQFWFKNRRAKCKRLKMSLFDSPSAGLQPQQQSYHHHLAAALSADAYQNRD